MGGSSLRLRMRTGAGRSNAASGLVDCWASIIGRLHELADPIFEHDEDYFGDKHTHFCKLLREHRPAESESEEE